MKNIVFLITCMSVGGAEKVLIDLVNNLDKSKYNITVMLVYKENIYDTRNIKFDNYFNDNIKIRYMCNNSSRLLYRLFNIALNRLNNKCIHRIFIGNKYDVEIAFSEGLPTNIISKSINKKSKKIAWLHTDSKNRTKNMNLDSIKYEKNIYLSFDEIIAVSKSVAESFENIHNLEDKVNVKYNPIDIKKIREKSREKIDLRKSDKMRFISIGRLTPIKGHERLIRAFKNLKEDGFDFELLIVGDGELKENLKGLINSYNLQNEIILVGLQTNPYKYLSKSDILICSSFVEGYSTVVLEAINLYKPVITTNCNGMREIFGDNECGIICENNDVDLYKALRRIISDKNIVKKYIDECKLRSLHFNIKNIIGQIEEVIK
ncbi:glycosyltransferase [Clostridium sp. D53t1_180928_C8]|uniref:glycosyltransferase n=1 Tax=Clostridium sp. D53t1_180928_C8 TaxID=2787101 RepID=UPI0018AADA03|nr:glycosyltransferase [Clostridium sp. D53t1_180928_C8]